MLKPSLGLAAAALLALSCSAVAAESSATLERGRYLVQIGGCNDCHTPNFAMSGGQVAESQWLTGDSLGWHGPWGTTYPPNLRRYMAGIAEEEWVQVARHADYRPPMPSLVLRAMSEQDLRAIYRFVRALGPAGEAAPAYLPPDQQAVGPVVRFPMPEE